MKVAIWVKLLGYTDLSSASINGQQQTGEQEENTMMLFPAQPSQLWGAHCWRIPNSQREPLHLLPASIASIRGCCKWLVPPISGTHGFLLPCSWSPALCTLEPLSNTSTSRINLQHLVQEKYRHSAGPYQQAGWCTDTLTRPVSAVSVRRTRAVPVSSLQLAAGTHAISCFCGWGGDPRLLPLQARAAYTLVWL